MKSNTNHLYFIKPSGKSLDFYVLCRSGPTLNRVWPDGKTTYLWLLNHEHQPGSSEIHPGQDMAPWALTLYGPPTVVGRQKNDACALL